MFGILFLFRASSLRSKRFRGFWEQRKSEERDLRRFARKRKSNHSYSEEIVRTEIRLALCKLFGALHRIGFEVSNGSLTEKRKVTMS